MDTVNLSQAARLAGVTDKTMREWLKAGRFPSAKFSQPKGRGFWTIDRAEVEAVAKEVAAPIADQGAAKLAELVEKLGTLEREIALLKGRVLALETIRSPGPEVADQDDSTPAPRPGRQPKAAPAVPVKLHKDYQTGGTLPEGYIPLFVFYKSHNISHNTASRWHEKAGGAVGEWVDATGHAFNRALSPADQGAFYSHFSKFPGFASCPRCPHNEL